jgi:DNA-binding response OmpR family regulator
VVLSSQAQRDPRDAYEALMFGLAKTVLYLFEPNRDVAAGLKLALREGGITNTRSFASPAELLMQLQQNPPDAVILSENPDHNVFDLAKQIRHGDIGRNPFAVMSVLVSETKTASRDLAVRCGADAILIKPVHMERIKEQLIRLGRARLPFIATTDYIGPERRTSTDRPSVIPQIKVVNTLQYRLEGRQLAQHAIDQAITMCMTQVWTSQLQSSVLKFHYICKTVAANQSTPEMLVKAKDLIAGFVATLEMAAAISRKISRITMNELCVGLAARAAPLMQNNGALSAAELQTLHDITAAFSDGLAKHVAK